MLITKLYAGLCNGDKVFFLHEWLGTLLLAQESKAEVATPRNKKIESALLCAQNPYTLNPSNSLTSVPAYSSLTLMYAKVLTWLCEKSFTLARLFLYWPLRPKFRTTKEAIAVYRTIYPGKQQRVLCLPRVFFSAACSKSFKESGTGFIGAFLPSRKMHAWIIENNENPDPDDDIWICYQPVAVIY